MLNNQFLLSDKKSYTIPLELASPIKLDNYWIPEGDGFWFKPLRLDTVNSAYTCLWYGSKSYASNYHHHSGATIGMVLHGLIRFIDQSENQIIANANSYVYLPGGITHKACFEVDEKGFLFYGTIEGNINHLNAEGECEASEDVFTYVKVVTEHYGKNKLDLSMLEKIII